MRCRRCGYPISYNNIWRIDFSSFNAELHLRYDQDVNSFSHSCISDEGDFKSHTPESKSNNFKTIYDILNDDNL